MKNGITYGEGTVYPSRGVGGLLFQVSTLSRESWNLGLWWRGYELRDWGSCHLLTYQPNGKVIN